MRSLLLLLVLLGLARPGHAQRQRPPRPERLPLWPVRTGGQPPPQQTHTLHQVLKITSVTTPLLEARRPRHRANGAAVIISPGGGNRFLAWDLEGTKVAYWRTGQGYTAFVLQYSVPNQQKAALQVVQRAIRLGRANYSVNQPLFELLARLE